MKTGLRFGTLQAENLGKPRIALESKAWGDILKKDPQWP